MIKKTVLKVEGLKKSYGDIEALKSLTFSMEEGEVFGLLGPNGAGKSTTLECILGTKVRDAGEVTLLGKETKRRNRHIFQDVGVQFQDAAWPQGLRVGEACEATACLYDPVPEWHSRLKSFDLLKKIDKPIETLSGGERQKLSILQACIHSPRIIFLDELTTGLDPLARRETWAMIQSMTREGVSVLLTSHFMDEVEFLCKRGLVLREGEVVVRGSIEEIKEKGCGQSLEEAYINHVKSGAAV